MNNKSVFIIIFTLFFFNTTTECMLARVSQLVATNGKNLMTKTAAPALAQQDSTDVSNKERYEQLSPIVKKAAQEELARKEIQKNTNKETLKYSRNIPSWNVAK